MKEKGKNPQVLHMKNYKAIFEGIESTLIKVGSANLTTDKILSNLDEFKHYEDKEFSDDDYYWILVYVIFYSGFKAATVSTKLKLIRKYFPDYETVAGYDEKKVKRMLGDADMIRNKRKVLACIENAKVFKKIVGEYGSFKAYIDSFSPTASFENLMLLKEELEYQFNGLGRITTYHVLTDIGLPVLKPDRVICRIFKRLGLIESDKQLLKTVILGQKFAQATGQPIRYIDIVFVAYGQKESKEFGLTSGICLDLPSCSICGVKAYCNYYASNTEGLDDNSSPMRPSLNSSITNPKRKRFVKLNSRAKTSSTHGGKSKKFDWHIEGGNVFILTENGIEHNYSLLEVFKILIWLNSTFKEDWFPLANNVELMGKGKEKDGLGIAILNLSPNDISHAQGSSYLGVVLEELGILEWNGAKKGIQWRIIRMPARIHQLEKEVDKFQVNR